MVEVFIVDLLIVNFYGNYATHQIKGIENTGASERTGDSDLVASRPLREGVLLRREALLRSADRCCLHASRKQT